MQRRYDYHSSSYSMDEYLARLDRIQRMPSMVADYPAFPNVHEVLNNNSAVATKDEKNHHQKKVSSNNNNHMKQKSDPEKKVHFIEQDKKTKEAGNKSIDAEADGFIQQKLKGFALCKWDTFRVY